MLVALQGIVYDGSERSPLVPQTARRAMEIPLGSSVTLQLSAISVARVPVALVGQTVKMTIKRSFVEDVPLLTITAVLLPGEGVNRADFTFTPAQSKKLGHGRFVYDVWMTSGAGERQQLIPMSPLMLLPAIGLP